MKGITPVIAIVLLLMITIAMVGFAFVWFQGMWRTTSETTGSQITAQQEAMMKTIVIDNVACTTGKIYVRNTGSKEIAASEMSVYVGGTLSTCSITPNPLTPGALGTCSHPTFPIVSGTAVKATSPGSVDTTTC
ncbi:MAG: hypothetical protein HZB66_01415 [Candidatus Aenigmarchaeota archaeon]|nr:hypothetical protein [Candidatus Aenigmarchaeota archaeon]